MSHTTQYSWVARNPCEQDVEPFRRLWKVLHVNLTHVHDGGGIVKKDCHHLNGTWYMVPGTPLLHRRSIPLSSMGHVKILCVRCTSKKRQGRNLIDPAAHCGVASFASEQYHTRITRKNATRQSRSYPGSVVVYCSELLSYLVQVRDVINNLSVVWDDRVKLLKRLKRVAWQSQVHVHQAQVVYRLHAVHLRTRMAFRSRIAINSTSD